MRVPRGIFRYLSLTVVASVIALGAVVSIPTAANAAASISQVPKSFATTDGDILTTNIAVMAGTRAVMIGGDFRNVRTPDGKNHPASFFAILDLANPNRVIYAASGVNNYVRSSFAHAGMVYVGGDFTTFGGKARNRTAAISASTLALMSWNPGASDSVWAISATNFGVFYGGDFGSLRAVGLANSTIPGKIRWSKSVVGGSVRVILRSPNNYVVYAGGLFESLGGFKQHGLFKLRASDGANYTEFKPPFRPNTYKGSSGTYDGDCILSLVFDPATNRLIVGGGGALRNILTSLDANTGNYRTSGWKNPEFRYSEGDIQAVQLVGDTVVMGYHRSHGNNPTKPATKRFVTLMNKSTGTFSTSWDAGLWGYIGKGDHGNGGVQGATYDLPSRNLVLVGAFAGYGDAFNNGGAGENLGASPPGIVRKGIAVFTANP